MKSARLGRLAVLSAAVALAIPAIAQANEVTKWNEIAVNTINAQPPITSGPPAGAVFVAMVAGLVGFVAHSDFISSRARHPR